jgi:hypothetical protein
VALLAKPNIYLPMAAKRKFSAQKSTQKSAINFSLNFALSFFAAGKTTLYRGCP